MIHCIPLSETRRVFNFLDSLTLDPNLFEDAVIDNRINRQEMINSIIMRCGTLQPIYTDTRVFKIFINTFFNKYQRTITKLLDSELFEYNPIENYNMNETINESHTGNDDLKHGKTVTSVFTPTVTTNQITSPNLTETTNVSAFDSVGYSPSEQRTTTGNSSVETKTSGNNNNVDTNSGTDSTVYNSQHSTTTSRSGNIGVTTTQQMIEQERKTALFSVYDWIAVEFEVEFFICAT